MKFTNHYLKEDYHFYNRNDLKPEDKSDAEALAIAEHINVSPDNELFIVVKDLGQNVIGALWTGWIDNKFNFDVVVSLRMYNQGLGKELVDEAIKQYESEKQEDSIFEVKVASNIMKHILNKKGFIVSKEMGGQWIMTRR